MTETKDLRWQQWLDGVASHMRQRGAHPARTVVLLPYAQLMPQAARLWAQRHPDGFAPRFETTQNWLRSLGARAPAPSDFCFDPALDVLTAHALLEQAGLGLRAEAATRLLLEAAQQLAPLAAAVAPAQRPAWATRMRSAAVAGMDPALLALEAAVAQIAVTWLATSAFPTDVLYEPQTQETVDCLVATPGFQPDPLLASLQLVWGERMALLALGEAAAVGAAPALHRALDAQDEAQRAAACVLRHVQAGRTPVALAVTDRALTRRVRAMLAAQGVQIRDETGWKLSTSRSGAHVMGVLRAAAWNASSDAVLDWLKNAPIFDAARVNALEAALRRAPQRAWLHVSTALDVRHDLALTELLNEVQALRETLKGPCTLAQWLTALRDLLERAGQWPLLEGDVAGVAVLSALHLNAESRALPEQALWARRRLSLAEFTRWADQVLEAHSFKPEHPTQEQVIILPLAQMLGRRFAAAVIAGCDEVRLNPAPEPPGAWTAAQRAALGLPARETLEAALRASWREALATPQVELLWRSSDEGGEPLLPSPLVQQIRLTQPRIAALDPRDRREIKHAPVHRPAPAAPQLGLGRLSASAYQDLRHCPYRYHALRQLGLKEAEEIEGELGKRDFGLWLHAVLQRFHSELDSTDRARRSALLDAAAQAVAQEKRLAEDEFLPFACAWPQVREGYLDWLAAHEAEGWRYAEGESEASLPLGEITLVGRLDRMDRAADGALMVIDYKTEPRDTTSRRIKDPYEDTQLAFYAALRPEGSLRAAYVNVSERDGAKTYEQTDIVAVRDALVEGIMSDLGRIAGGAALPALGEGVICEFCAARGLCRKDFWSEV